MSFVPLVQMTIRGPVPGFLTTSETNKCLRAGFDAVMKLWGSQYRDKHFGESATREYDYDIRTIKYMRRKMARWGHQRPLEWSGKSRTNTEAGRVWTAVSPMTGPHVGRTGNILGIEAGKFIMNAPTLNLIPEGKRTSMREEMTRWSSREETQALAVFRRVVGAAFDRLDNSKVRWTSKGVSTRGSRYRDSMGRMY